MTKSILLSDKHVTGTVNASREGIASATKIDDYVDGIAFQVTTNPSFGEGDYVVHSIANSDGRRKVVVLHGVVSKEIAMAIPGFASIEENDVESFGVDSIIWMTDGDNPVELDGVCRIAA